MNKWLVGLVCVAIAATTAMGQVNLAAGTPVSQDFDSIGTDAIATLPSGWRVDKNTGSRQVGTYADAVTATERAGGNSLASNAGNGIYNYGAGPAASAVDRAIGWLSSGTATKSGNLYVHMVNSGASSITSVDIAYNVEKYRDGSNAEGFSIQLYYSTDGATWTSAGATFLTSFPADADNSGYDPAPGATVAVSGTLDLAATPIPAAGALYLAWNYSVTTGTATGNAQALGVDDVSVSVSGPVVFSVAFDQAEGFEVEQGTSADIIATAQNGAEPYSYEWETTMAVADYTVAGNVFMILDTAATGGFSATVTATDDDSDEAVNTINFSVVAPAAKYAITITPPVNGSVTTTPETEAEEGQTVTINATPDGGYAVDTITVTDATMTPVPVSGSTFTMPASAVSITVTFMESVGETYVVDFEGEGETTPGTGYGPHDVTLSGKTWNFVGVLIGTTDPDWKNGARSARLRGYAESAMTMTEDLPTGLGTISFLYRRYGTDAQVDWMVEYSVNGGTSWTQIGADFTAPASDDVQTFSEAVNVAGNVRVRIKRATETGATNRRLNIDDITMTPAGAAGFSVSFDKADNFEIEEGAGDAITATASGGAAPYGYEWVSSLDGAHYEAPNNVFTILATAPIGDYSATVTATDDDLDEVSNTINFSVVAPTPKYDIFITPADNGAIETDPVDEAEAGQTVTVITTPDPGYALETITVTQADTTPVTVSGGGTFTMPAQAVYVTASFIESQDPDALITFEDATLPTSYVDNTAVLEDGKTWATRRVVRGNLDNDRKIDSLSARLYPQTDSEANLQQSEPYAEAITKLSFWVGSFGTDNMANVVLLVQVSSDGVEWDTVATLAGAADITDTLVEHVIETIPEGAVYVRFYATAEAATNKRINIDNIGIFHGEAAPYLTYTGSATGTVGVQMELDFTLHGASAEGWAWWVMTADRDPIVGAEGDTYQVRWTPHAVGDYILTVTAYGPGMEILAQREVTLTVNPVGPGDPYVTITGDLTGTVGEQMDLLVELFDGTADTWWIDLRDPDNVASFAYSWDELTGEFSFTPDEAGTWNLTAWAVVGMNPIATSSQDLVVSEASATPPIATITMVPDGGGDFTFQVPDGWALIGLEGANTTLDDAGEFAWYPMTLNIHYTYDDGTGVVRILTDTLMPGEIGRMIRLLLTPGQ